MAGRGRRAGRPVTPESKEKQRQLLELKRSGMSDEEVAERLAYKNGDSVRVVYHRLLDRYNGELISDRVNAEVDRLDALFQAQWPAARRGDAKAALVCVRIIERKSKFWGLDHADGLLERQVNINEAQAGLVMQFLQAVLDELELTQEQRAKLPGVAREKLALVSGQ